MWMSLSADVDVVVERWASLWGITAPLAVCATPVTHAMSPIAISRSLMGIAATLLTALPTCAIITAGSYLLKRGLVTYDARARDMRYELAMVVEVMAMTPSG